MAPARPPIELDHLVVACRSLAAARTWCEATFGVAPETGGRHALMGTHNLLLSIASPRFPKAYLEMIAIDPDVPAPGRPRWFELDRPELQAAIAAPRLVHWVARCDDIVAAADALGRAGYDAGAVVDAERMSARGLLRWRIALPANGRRHAEGAVPLLIEWGAVHPADALPASGVELRSLRIGGVPPGLAEVFGVSTSTDGDHPLVAELSTPGGPVRLEAPAGSG